jgi:thymidylate synthase
MQNTVKDIRNSFLEKYKNEDFVTDKTGVKTIEIVSASFVADEDSIFGTPNQIYIDREIQWYESQSLSVNDLVPTPKIWQQISDDYGNINSNYGYLIFNSKNHNQYIRVREALSLDHNTRRAVMIYQRPTMHYEYNVNGMSDFICTNAVQYLIRNDQLHAVVQMRSNDVVFGYRNDYAWQKYVLDKLANDLKVEAGTIHWNVGSLHVYERHFNYIEDEIFERAKKVATHLADKAMGNYFKKVSEFYDHEI